MSFMITGITGTLGQRIARKLLARGNFVVGYSRDEYKQQRLASELSQYRETLRLYLGDIRDRDRLVEASRHANWIYHCAALKHVDKLEENPEEAIQTNIYGTMNVLHAQRINEVDGVILASTDKAVFPINAYGKSKALAEDLVLRGPIGNTVCRYGNVLGSRGSVLQTFVDSLKNEKTVRITDSKMTRFWWLAEDAAEFVLSSAGSRDSIRIPTLRAANIMRVAGAVAKLLGVSGFKVETVGIRRGEKLHEWLDQFTCSNHENLQMTDNELESLIEKALAEEKA